MIKTNLNTLPTTYTSYYWNHGIPKGFSKIKTSETPGTHYKIVSDPYHKRYSIEKYSGSTYVKTLYDSAAFDFRLLKPAEQMGWQKETLSEDTEMTTCLIRNLDDRVILTEENFFEKGLCTGSRAYCPLGKPISIQTIYSTRRGDVFNGVLLKDMNHQPITFKRYAVNKEGEFTEVLEEHWSMHNVTLPAGI